MNSRAKGALRELAEITRETSMSIASLPLTSNNSQALAGQYGNSQHKITPWTKTSVGEGTDYTGPRASCTDSNLFKNVDALISISRLYARSGPVLQTAFTPCLISYDMLFHDQCKNIVVTSVVCALAKLQNKQVPTLHLIMIKQDRLGRFPELT